MEVNCKNCNKLTNKKKSYLKKYKNFFCSIDCRKEYYIKINRENRICPECKSLFNVKKSDKKIFCSQSCSAKYNNKIRIRKKICYTCKNELDENYIEKNKKKFCSKFCYEKTLKIKKEKLSNMDILRNWRKKTKRKIILSLGGECQICGYKRSYSALEAHHLKPEDKSFGISESLKNPIAWTKIEDELKKCVLLCGNCHREVHAGLIKIPNKMYFDKVRIDTEIYSKKVLKYDKCPICKKDKKINLKYCSHECRAKSREKINWDNIDLENLIKEHGNPEKVGKFLGVSGTLIRKRLKKSRKI